MTTSRAQFETRFLRLVAALAGHCPLSPRYQNAKDWKKWAKAYNELFRLAADIGKVAVQ